MLEAVFLRGAGAHWAPKRLGLKEVRLIGRNRRVIPAGANLGLVLSQAKQVDNVGLGDPRLALDDGVPGVHALGVVVQVLFGGNPPR